jgi:50S ribosomal subunit-associated GTPase HflX
MDLKGTLIDVQGGKSWAQKHGAHYIEVSAKTGQNVELLMDTIVELIDSKQ